MKSTDIKNWSYTLDYKDIIRLEDFLSILTKAIAHDSCICCGGNRVENCGLCTPCVLNNRDKNTKEAVKCIEERYEVLTVVRERKIAKN